AYPFVETPFDDTLASFSPDGNWVAFDSGPNTQPEVYVKSFSNPQKQWQVSTDGGMATSWRNDGKELLYVRGQKIFSVDVEWASEPSFGTPKLLFSLPENGTFGAFAPDGQRFLFLQRPANAGQDVFRFVSNWSE